MAPCKRASSARLRRTRTRHRHCTMLASARHTHTMQFSAVLILAASAAVAMVPLPSSSRRTSPNGAVTVEQFGECQCPLTSSWFSGACSIMLVRGHGGTCSCCVMHRGLPVFVFCFLLLLFLWRRQQFNTKGRSCCSIASCLGGAVLTPCAAPSVHTFARVLAQKELNLALTCEPPLPHLPAAAGLPGLN